MSCERHWLDIQCVQYHRYLSYLQASLGYQQPVNRQVARALLGSWHHQSTGQLCHLCWWWRWAVVGWTREWGRCCSRHILPPGRRPYRKVLVPVPRRGGPELIVAINPLGLILSSFPVIYYPSPLPKVLPSSRPDRYPWAVGTTHPIPHLAIPSLVSATQRHPPPIDRSFVRARCSELHVPVRVSSALFTTHRLDRDAPRHFDPPRFIRESCNRVWGVR